MNHVQKCECFVITGGPSVGKTTLVNALQKRGRQVLEESAAQIILEGREHPNKERSAFQRAVLRRQLELEQSMFACGGIWYADRGLLDGAVYHQHHDGYVPDSFYELDVSHYKAAFLLEPLSSFEKNGVRPDFEDLEYTEAITPLFGQIYRSRGVPVYFVPSLLSVEERLVFIESTVAKLRASNSVFYFFIAGAGLSLLPTPLAFPNGDFYETLQHVN